MSAAAKEVGYNSKISGKRLILDGESFACEDMDILPLSVIRGCGKEKLVDGGLAFRGERSVFSLFYTKPFVIKGMKFLS